MGDWIRLDDRKPGRGERCIVWDVDYRCPDFACWFADEGHFEEWTRGGYRPIRVEFWMPEPEMPPGYATGPLGIRVAIDPNLPSGMVTWRDSTGGTGSIFL